MVGLNANFSLLEGCLSVVTGYSSGVMKLFSFILVAVSLSAISCERHEFEGPNGTRKLHEHHSEGVAHETSAAGVSEHAEPAKAH